MKFTIAFKKLDLAIQLLLLLYIVTLFFNRNSSLLFTASLPAWQLFSAAVHTIFRFSYASYHRSQAFAFLLFCLTFLIYACLLFFFYVSFFPVVILSFVLLALYYIYACFDEIRILHHKSIVHLK